MKIVVQRLWHGFTRAEDYSAILALLISLGLVNLSVASRLAIHYESPAWEELARFASVWMYLLGTIVASKEGSHLRMGFLETKIRSIRLKLAMKMTNDFAMVAIFCILTWWAFGDVLLSIGRGESSLILRLGIWVVRSSFLVGGFFSAMHILLNLISSTRKFINSIKCFK